MLRHRRTVGTAAALTLGAVATAVFGFAAPASAHVTVNPSEATQGGYATVAFRVPNESDDASTTKLEVVLPADAPVALGVDHAGARLDGGRGEAQGRPRRCKVHGSEITEAVSKITWTAAGERRSSPGSSRSSRSRWARCRRGRHRWSSRRCRPTPTARCVRWIEEPTGGRRGAGAPGAGAHPHRRPPARRRRGAHRPAGRAAADDDDADGDGVAAGLGDRRPGRRASGGLLLGGLAFARTRRAGGAATATRRRPPEVIAPQARRTIRRAACFPGRYRGYPLIRWSRVGKVGRVSGYGGERANAVRADARRNAAADGRDRGAARRRRARAARPVRPTRVAPSAPGSRPCRHSGHAVVVRDVDELLRAEAPFARAGQARLRLDARTPDGPAFVGLAPPTRCGSGSTGARTPRCAGWRWPGARCRSGWSLPVTRRPPVTDRPRRRAARRADRPDHSGYARGSAPSSGPRRAGRPAAEPGGDAARRARPT